MKATVKDSLTLAAESVASARRFGADEAEAFYYTSQSLSVSYRLGKPEQLEREENAVLSLRVFVGQQSAMVSSTDTVPSALQELAQRAVAMAKLAPVDPYSESASEALLAKNIPDLDLYDATPCTAEWLKAQCAEAESSALAVDGISNSEGAEASAGNSEMSLVTSKGFSGSYRSSHASLSVSVLAGSGTAMERDYESSSTRFAKALRAPSEIGREAAKRALARLNPRKVVTQRVPVLFDPRVSRRLLSTFASAINGNAIAKGTSFLGKSMHKEIFPRHVTIVDDPLMKRGLGSRPFDGEGLSTRTRELVKGGVLQRWLLDVRSANKLGLNPEGNATRGIESPPSPSPSNLYMISGELTPKALMGDIANGFYVTELIGMGVNLVTGDYSQGASGFWIKNGSLDYPVSEVTIAGKLQDMFREVTPANDLQFIYAINAPTLRVEGMMVGGK